MYIKKITKLGAALYGLRCPLCGDILASSSEADMLPEFAVCDCDRNGNKQQTYELFVGDGGRQMIRRNKFPRFVAEVTFGQLSDLENVVWLDECTDPMALARAMRKAAEFLIKKQHDRLED